MNSARERILANLNSVKVHPKSSDSINFKPWGAEEVKSTEEKMTRFCQALTANHAEIHHLQSQELAQTIQQLCHQKKWQQASIGTQGEWHDEFKKGLQSIKVIEFEQDIEHWKTTLFRHVDVGITHVLAGIADTGALVLWPSEDEPRTLSLVPPCHVAIMHASTLFHHFGEVVETQQWSTHMPTNALLISGPSKTADIQQTLAYGAHGPSELIVLILSDK